MTKIRDINAFLQICRLRSIRKASEYLSISQSALTKIVQQLEHEMGAKLLDRLPRGVEPTIYGANFAEHARFALAELGKAKEFIDCVSRGKLGRIRIGASAAAAHILLPSIVDRINAASPGADIHITEDTVDALDDALRNSELDLVLSSVTRSGADREVEITPLLDDKLVVVASVRHEIFRVRNPNLNHILSYPWVFVGTDPIRESRIMPLFSSRGLPMPQSIMETNSFSFLIKYLATSNCFSYQSRRLIESVRDAGIGIVPIASAVTEAPIMFLKRKNALLTPIMRLAIEEAKRVSSEIVGSESSPRGAARIGA